MVENDYNLSHVSFAVLGLVAEQPSHAKSIIDRIEERGMRNWTEIGDSSVYGVLKKLREDELVNMEIREENEEGKAYTVKIHTITPNGYKILKSTILNTIQFFRGRYDPNYDLAISMLDVLSKEEAIKAFEHSKIEIEKAMTFLEENEQVTIKQAHNQWNKYPLTIKALFYRPKEMREAHIKFIDWMIEQIKVEEKWGKY